MCKIDGQWEAAVEIMEPSSVLCDDLEVITGSGGVGGRVLERGAIWERQRETEKKDRKEGEKEGGKKETMEKKSRTVTATTQWHRFVTLRQLECTFRRQGTTERPMWGGMEGWHHHIYVLEQLPGWWSDDGLKDYVTIFKGCIWNIFTVFYKRKTVIKVIERGIQI